MTPRTLAEAIELTALSSPKRGFRFVRNDKFDHDFHTFTQLEDTTRKLAGAMQDAGLTKGDRLALILPEADQFVPSFLAALRAGVIPVPIYPPTGVGQLAGYVDNTRHIVHNSGAKMLLTTPSIKPLLGKVQGACPALSEVLTFASLRASNATFSPVQVAPSDTAFLQFTSGSTNSPKGVVLTHDNLMANIHNILVEGLRADPQLDAGLTWLPLFHDMGLIGFVLAPIAHGIEVTFLSPMLFLRRPSVWVRGMSRFGASISFGPNFAYALSIKRVRARDIEGIDLSKWRVAGCGAEPIRAETLEAFAEHYAAHGFEKEAFTPAYGLAESTLAVSFSKSIPTDRVKASALWSNKEAVACDESEPGALRIVACGKAFQNHQIAVFALDDESCERPLPDRKVGEVRLKGPSVSPGYFEAPSLTADAFRHGWFCTGDLGYLVDGTLHICGRAKEIVIVNGRNFYPQDIEWEASQVAGVRGGNAIPIGTRGEREEREAVTLVFETAISDATRLDEMVREIRGRVQQVVGLMLDDVLPLAPGVLPKTSSGKLQRTKTRALYQEGKLVRRRGQREDCHDRRESDASTPVGEQLEANES
ncbi:MAG: fatty acyl-AMP ligase [Myxococcota bacterium]